MKALNIANDALGNRARLDSQYARDGYLFFRGVLDLEAVAAVRRTWLDILAGMGVIAPGSEVPIWNGADLSNFPFKVVPIETSGSWQRFVRTPSIDGFFRAALGEAPWWVPITEHRVVPPGADDGADPFVYRHQDGYSNRGIDFRVCWIPLVDIDARSGGLAVAEGWHTRGIMHEAVGNPPAIAPATIPDDAWRRSDYHPGDVLMFSLTTPHSGMRNRSDRFRLSMDLRVLPASAHRPIIGDVVAVRPEAITIRDDETGSEVVLGLDARSFVRGHLGVEMTLDEVPEKIRPGEHVIAAWEGGRAVMIRPHRGHGAL
ncbi:MAG: phytanoyl-CoA dioxygenase family protein [Gammaproteobacteria bacterium]